LDFFDFLGGFCREEVDVMTVEEMGGRDLKYLVKCARSSDIIGH